MCGRIVYDPQEKRLPDYVTDIKVPPRPSTWNLAPTQDAVVIARDSEGALAARLHRWGLIPSWVSNATNARRIGAACINARGESVHEKPAFRAAFARRRCLVPVCGWFEWAGEGKTKQPYYCHAVGRELLLLAGIWEAWRDPATGEDVRSFAVVTTEPNALAGRIHDRMPVVLDASAWDRWLAPTSTRDELVALLRPCPEDVLAVHPVGRAVGSVRNDSPDLIAPVRAA